MSVNIYEFFQPFIDFWSSEFFEYCLAVLIPSLIVAVVIKTIRGLFNV